MYRQNIIYSEIVVRPERGATEFYRKLVHEFIHLFNNHRVYPQHYGDTNDMIDEGGAELLGNKAVEQKFGINNGDNNFFIAQEYINYNLEQILALQDKLINIYSGTAEAKYKVGPPLVQCLQLNSNRSAIPNYFDCVQNNKVGCESRIPWDQKSWRDCVRNKGRNQEGILQSPPKPATVANPFQPFKAVSSALSQPNPATAKPAVKDDCNLSNPIPTTPPPPTTPQPTSTELPQNLLIKVQCNSTGHCTIKVSENLNPRSNSNIPVEIYQNGKLDEIRECFDNWRHWLSKDFVNYSDKLYPEVVRHLNCPKTMTTTKATLTPQATTLQDPIITQGAATLTPQATTLQEPTITQGAATLTPQATTLQDPIITQGAATLTPQATTLQEPTITQGAATLTPHATTLQDPIITQGAATLTPQATTLQEPLITQGAATLTPQATTLQEPTITQHTKTPSATTSTSTTTEKTTKTAYAMPATSAEVDSTSPEPAADHGSAPPYIWQIVGTSCGILAGLMLGGSIILCIKKKWLCWSHGDNDQTKTHQKAEYKLVIQENGPSTDSENSSSSLKTLNSALPVFMLEGTQDSTMEVPFIEGYNYIMRRSTNSSITVNPPPPPRLPSLLAYPQDNDPYIPPLRPYHPHRDKNQNIHLSTDAENTTQPDRVTLASRPRGSRNTHVRFKEDVTNVPPRPLPGSKVLGDPQPLSSFKSDKGGAADTVLKLVAGYSNSTPMDIGNSGEFKARSDGATPICNRRAGSNDVTNFSSIDYTSPDWFAPPVVPRLLQ